MTSALPPASNDAENRDGLTNEEIAPWIMDEK